MAFSIIIPSRTASNLVPCILAIREAGETARIIVVDDFPYPLPDGFSWQASGLDLTRDIVTTGADPFVFARNVNIGIKTAGTDDVILLNDDALLETSKGFSSIGATQSARPEFGLIAASCNTVGNVNQHRQCRLTGGLLREESRMVCFVCIYIPRSTINAVGLLDERFVGYGMDDDDYCLRVRAAGLKIGIFDGCFVDHGSLTSSYRGPDNGGGKGGDYRPNMKLFIEKWGVDNRGLGKDRSPFKALFP